jgi:5-methylcytosine-specific restriction endonuclease McrA
MEGRGWPDGIQPSSRIKNASKARRRLLQRDGNLCHWCKFPMSFRHALKTCSNFATLEHLVRRRDGGTNDLSNLVLACRKCNHERN